jgi:hypothetical protein
MQIARRIVEAETDTVQPFMSFHGLAKITLNSYV